MSVNDTVMTVVGNVVDEPKMRLTKSGVAVTNFRVASTPRRRDGDGQWSDGTTLYLNVTSWRALAENVQASVHKGQPVVVTGRFFAREYEIDEAKRVSYEIDAVAVGHDLSRGTTRFERVARASVPAQVIGLDADGIPADPSEVWIETSDDGGSDESELSTSASGRQLVAAG